MEKNVVERQTAESVLEPMSDEVSDMSCAGNEADIGGQDNLCGNTEELDGSDGSQDLDWTVMLEKKKDGRLYQTMRNAELIFDNDPELAGLVGENIFSGRIELRKTPPWKRRMVSSVVRDTNKVGPLWHHIIPEPEWRNSDNGELYAYLSRKYGLDKTSVIDMSLRNIASRNGFHEVRDYFSGLKWDGVNRIDTLVPDYFGVADKPFIRIAVRKTLVAAVARVFEPGCQFDATLSFYSSQQGAGKSMFWKNLAGQWYSELVIDIGSKDALMIMEGTLIIELAELTALRASSVEKIKAIITRKDDRYRKPYEKLVESHPRQCIFVATTNQANFLKDCTGNRRFWPIDVTQIKPPKKSIWNDLPSEADQIWAEAKKLYDDGEQLFLDPEMSKAAEEAAKAFMEYDPLLDAIEEYLARRLPANWSDMTPQEHREWLANDKNVGTVRRTEVCLKEIIFEALSEIVGENPSKKTLNRISEIICSISYDDGLRWHKPESQRRYKYFGKQRVYRLH